MLLCDAKAEIDARIEIIEKDFKDNIPDYLEALKIASRSIEAQIRLTDVLNDFFCGFAENDSISLKLAYGMLKQFSIFAEFDEDGMLIEDDEQGAD